MRFRLTPLSDGSIEKSPHLCGFSVKHQRHSSRLAQLTYVLLSEEWIWNKQKLNTWIRPDKLSTHCWSLIGFYLHFFCSTANSRHIYVGLDRPDFSWIYSISSKIGLNGIISSIELNMNIAVASNWNHDWYRVCWTMNRPNITRDITWIS